jgi:hypothetical protein
MAIQHMFNKDWLSYRQAVVGGREYRGLIEHYIILLMILGYYPDQPFEIISMI